MEEDNTMPFSTNIIFPYHGNMKNDINIVDIKKYHNLAEGISDLLLGPSSNVYLGNEDWCFPFNKVEAALYLLRPQHIGHIQQKMSNMRISDRDYFFLLLLLCGDIGTYEFKYLHYLEPVKFNNMNVFEIYTFISHVRPPTDEYKLTPALMDKIYSAFLNGYHMYYVLLYSRRVLKPKILLDQFNSIEDEMQATHFVFSNYMFAGPSIAHNDLSTLVIEYLQHYTDVPNQNEPEFNIHSDKIAQRLHLINPYHNSRRQLLKVYNYTGKYLRDASPPCFINYKRDELIIRYMENDNVFTVDQNYYHDSNDYFVYYVVSLCSKLKANSDIEEGMLIEMTYRYTSIRYGIEYLSDVMSKYSSDESFKNKFMYGLATYHLLYQCYTGRTSIYANFESRDLSVQLPIRKLEQLVQKCIDECPILKDLPIYTSFNLTDEVNSIKSTMNKYTMMIGNNHPPKIDYTIELLCKSLDISIKEYAKIINSIKDSLDLHKYYGVIKTEFERNNKINKNYISKQIEILNTISDFQGRSALSVNNVEYRSFEDINSKLYVEDDASINSFESPLSLDDDYL